MNAFVLLNTSSPKMMVLYAANTQAKDPPASLVGLNFAIFLEHAFYSKASFDSSWTTHIQLPGTFWILKVIGTFVRIPG